MGKTAEKLHDGYIEINGEKRHIFLTIDYESNFQGFGRIRAYLPDVKHLYAEKPSDLVIKDGHKTVRFENITWGATRVGDLLANGQYHGHIKLSWHKTKEELQQIFLKKLEETAESACPEELEQMEGMLNTLAGIMAEIVETALEEEFSE